MSSSSFSSIEKSKTIEVPLQQDQVLEIVCNDSPTNPVELTHFSSRICTTSLLSNAGGKWVDEP